MGKKRDIRGMRFGQLVAIEPVGVNESGSVLWKLRCDCGNEIVRPTGLVTTGGVKSCGCLRHKTPDRLVDLTGRRFGRWIVLCRADNKKGRTMWHCRCDCGAERDVSASNLVKGYTTSCGCAARDINTERMKTHDRSTSRLYHVYAGMKARCYNKNSPAYKDYGGRGIAICDEWLGKDGFQHFWDWAYSSGYVDDASHGVCTLDRIDVNGNYEPSNCRWATLKQQARNKRNNRIVSFCGRDMPMSELSEITGVEHKVLTYRYEHGVRENELLKPMKRGRKKK